MIKENPHECKSTPYGGIYCFENKDGKLYLEMEEDTQVNYCPFCGYKAKVAVKVETKDEYLTRTYGTLVCNFECRHLSCVKDCLDIYSKRLPTPVSLIIKDDAFDALGELMPELFSVHFEKLPRKQEDADVFLNIVHKERYK